MDELHRIENELTQSLEELSKIKTILHQWGGPDGDAQKIVENINETHRRFLQQQDKVSLRRIFEMICCRKDVLEMYPEDFERFAKMVSKVPPPPHSLAPAHAPLPPWRRWSVATWSRRRTARKATR